MKKTSKIRDWYMSAYPTDELGNQISNATFSSALSRMKDGVSIYTILNVSDSLVRERVFTQMAILYKVPYNTIYDLWAYSTKKSIYSVKAKK